MKFTKNEKKLMFFLFLVFLCYRYTCLNSKFDSRQIFDKKDHEVEIYKESTIAPKSFRYFSYSNDLDKLRWRIGDASSENQNNSNFLEFLQKVLIAYLQFFILFCILSFYKFFEELNHIKLLHIAGKYSDVKDLTSEKYKDNISELNEENVFISGDTKIIRPAEDDVLKINIDKKYAMIYRKVEIFHLIKEKWVPLVENIGTNIFLNDDAPNVNLLNDHFMEIEFFGEFYQFPRLISKQFLGEVEIIGIALSPQQLKCLEKSENINLPQMTSEANIFSEFDLRNPHKIKWDANANYFYVYPCDKEDSKHSSCRLRISLKGYLGDRLTILAKLNNSTFKTYNTPYLMGEEDDFNQTTDVNLSSNMVIQSNIEYDLCNFIFCFCLSGPPSYYEKDNKTIHETQCMTTKTNWILEKKMTFNEMIYYKYDISFFRNNIIRLLFFYALLMFFAITEEPLYMSYKYTSNFDKENITAEFVKFNLIASATIILSIFLFSKISYKYRHCLSMCSVMFLIIILIILIIKELLQIN